MSALNELGDAATLAKYILSRHKLLGAYPGNGVFCMRHIRSADNV